MRSLKLLVLLGALISFTSCGDKIRKKIETEVLDKVGDPSSYKFIKYELVDSSFTHDGAEEMAEYYRKIVGTEEEALKRYQRYPSLCNIAQENLNDALEKLEFYESKLEKENKLLNYQYAFCFRAKNAFNAMQVYITMVYFDGDMNIIYIDDIELYNEE